MPWRETPKIRDYFWIFGIWLATFLSNCTGLPASDLILQNVDNYLGGSECPYLLLKSIGAEGAAQCLSRDSQPLAGGYLCALTCYKGPWWLQVHTTECEKDVSTVNPVQAQIGREKSLLQWVPQAPALVSILVSGNHCVRLQYLELRWQNCYLQCVVPSSVSVLCWKGSLSAAHLFTTQLLSLA